MTTEIRVPEMGEAVVGATVAHWRKLEGEPVAVAGQVAIHPMMYLALIDDHRIVDGREAVQFLVRVKELVESPETLLLEG